MTVVASSYYKMVMLTSFLEVLTPGFSKGQFSTANNTTIFIQVCINTKFNNIQYPEYLAIQANCNTIITTGL